jgi:rhamnosyltransferase
MESKLKIFALIVTFNPDLDSFGKNLSAISEQVDKVIIVDNSNVSKHQKELKAYIDIKQDIILIQPEKIWVLLTYKI